MFHVVLHQPKIPPNTGSIIRLCANSGSTLHLIQPLGFALDDRRLRRAGLDYHEFARVLVHASFAAFAQTACPAQRMFALSTHATTPYSEMAFSPGDYLLFGSETCGLPKSLLLQNQALRIPMVAGSRSLNLANAVAIVLYEAWRQNHFA